MLQKLNQYILEHKLFNNSDQIALAISGGKDSVFAAHILNELEIPFFLVHVNFNLRSEESDLDQSFVTQLGQNLKHCLGLFTKKINANEYAADKGISTQEAAREIRYAYFSELYQDKKFTRLITAHHQSDVLETFFINLYRKSGISGLRSIPVKRDFVIRPFLVLTQAEILEYIETNKISYREDSSNESLKYLRNTLRHKVLPHLELNLEDFGHRANASIKLINQEEVTLNFFLDAAIQSIISVESGRLAITKNKLLTYPHPSVVLYRIIDKFGFNSAHCDQILSSLNNENGQNFESRTHQLLIDREYIFIQAKEQVSFSQVQISGPGSFKTDFGVFSLEQNCRDSFNRNKLEELVDFSNIKFPLILKTWEKGEVFQPLGMQGKKLLSDFFIDQKIDNQLKNKTLVLCSENEVLWVLGHRISDKIKCTKVGKHSKISFTFE